jgi:hypothetical protein
VIQALETGEDIHDITTKLSALLFRSSYPDFAAADNTASNKDIVFEAI